MNNNLAFSLLSTFFCISLEAQTIDYAKNDIHAFLPQSNKFQITFGVEAINDTIDIFHIKEERFSGTTIGDMKGLNLELSYATDNLYLHTQYNRKHFDYNGPTLANNKFDIYLRYNIMKNNSFALSIDTGYQTNIADDMGITDLNTINKILSKAYPNKNIHVTEDTVAVDGKEYGGLKNSPSITLKDTSDQAIYARVISTYKSDHFIYDLYAGAKQIKIKNTITSSLSDEPDLQNTNFHAKREDMLLLVGISYSYELSNIIIEGSYEYNSIFRIASLQENTKNHVINGDILYRFHKNFLLFLGGELFTNQLNGQIPYLYQTYSQTSFDHLYGFAELGVIVKY